MASTLLRITEAGHRERTYVIRGTARSVTQSLYPLGDLTAMRALGGNLVNLLPEAFETHKYGSVISCQDAQIPAMEGIWKGTRLIIESLVRLMTPHIKEGEEIHFSRPYVEGSIIFQGINGTKKRMHRDEKPPIKATEQGIWSYRPRLEVVVMDFKAQHNEWGARAGWELVCEEA